MKKRGPKFKTPTERLPNRLREWLAIRGISRAQFAEALGADEETVRRYETGERGMSNKKMDRIAELLGIEPGELHTASRGRRIRVAGYIGAGAEVIAFDDGGEIDEITCPAGLDPANVVAVRVRGDSMFPITDGWDIVYSKTVDGVPDDAIGQLCVVKLTDGRRFIKHVSRGSIPGRFNLLSSNSPPILNAELRWAARVLTMLPGDLGLAA